MKGGFNDPPNFTCVVWKDVSSATSMKGGFNDPPNSNVNFSSSAQVSLQ